MKINIKKDAFPEFECSLVDMAILCNCLNEVCHGFALKNFADSIGAPKQDVKQLLKIISNVYDVSKRAVHICLEKKHLLIISNSIAQCLLEFNYPGEFHTRVGVDREEAEVLLNDLRKINTELS